MAFVIPDQLVLAALKAIELALSDPLNPNLYRMHLFVNDIVPNGQTQLTDFVEADPVSMPGYTSFLDGAFGNYMRDTEGNWIDDRPAALVFMSADAPVPVPVYGWYNTDIASTLLLSSGRFSVPRVMEKAGDGIYVDVLMQVNQDGRSLVANLANSWPPLLGSP